MKKYISAAAVLFVLTSCTSSPKAPQTEVPQESHTKMMEHDSMKTAEKMMSGSMDDMKKDMKMDAQDTWTPEQMKAMEKDAKMMSGSMDDMKMEKPMSDMVGEKGIYTEYAPNLVGMHEKTVLFFHAPWCPSCKAADNGIKKGDIPKNLAILKVDYDSSDELKQKYEVTYQHTFVLVDAKGNMVKKWSGGNTVQDILEEVQ